MERNSAFGPVLRPRGSDTRRRRNPGRHQQTEEGARIGRMMRDWKSLLPRPTSGGRGSYRGPSGFYRRSPDEFFEEARNLMENEHPGIAQEVIEFLAEETSLQFIRGALEMDISTLNSNRKCSFFEKSLLPFLETVSHSKVSSSLLLEQKLGTIFNFLYGLNGARASHFLANIGEVLETCEKDESHAWWMEVTLLVFSRIVEINSTAFIQEPLKELASRFQDIHLAFAASGLTTALHESQTYLEYILQRMDIGCRLPNDAKVPKREKPVVQYPIAYDPPGGRHDNDDADICNIQILPTIDEILSPRPEYLPPRNPAEWHVTGLEGLLDRNFRLLREDTVGQLRDAIFYEIERLKGRTRPDRKNLMRTISYHEARITKLSFDKFSGPQFEVSFPQPYGAVRRPSRDREEWWQLSKRLQSGALVCLLSEDQNVMFGIVCEKSKGENAKNSKKDDKPGSSLWRDPKTASVNLSLTDRHEANMSQLLNHRLAQKLILIEFPGILLASFNSTLKALQTMKQKAQLPFSELLIPPDLFITNSGSATTEDSASMRGSADVPPPVYALKPGFRFNLRSIINDNSDMFFSPNNPFDIETLKRKSCLDSSQTVALIGSLQHRIGLIQGPPGTGKSFTGLSLIKVLLGSKGSGKEGLGPIICVTYTNHALDQLLEALLDRSVTEKIIRIGSQSKSEKLEKLNLRVVSRELDTTRMERGTRGRLHDQLEELESDFQRLQLGEAVSPEDIRRHLRETHPAHFEQLFGMDEDGFQVANSHNPDAVLKGWLKGGSRTRDHPRSLQELNRQMLFSLSSPERHELEEHWAREIREYADVEATVLLQSHRRIKDMFDATTGERNLRCLRNADIIGLTTSGLARNLNMLQKLNSKVLICEEAGEVLEAHNLTALLPSIEHAILIGDQLQLRPQIQNYDLSRENPQGGAKYSLDVSLFERLVESRETFGSGLPYSTLEAQRRMHPSISQLVRETLYPKLVDAGVVAEYPEVAGVRKRLFWLDHRKGEADISESDKAVTTSHWNEYEIDMVSALVNHLVRQGKYNSGEIAVLTPYLGQLHRLRQRLGAAFAITLGEKDQEQLLASGFENPNSESASSTPIRSSLFDALRVATIDNFQGEEAKVVVISLVRSNEQRRCGFLRTSNRINVLLSRAQHGMYIIGNSETSGHVPMWAQVIDILTQNENIGTDLELQCPRHPETPISVSEPDHFVRFSPEGGCDLRCINRLSCGHACEQKCHSEVLHNAVYCKKPCARPRQGCDHPCPKCCGDVCPPNCTIVVFEKGRALECGHKKETLPCWQHQDPTLVKCTVPVNKRLDRCQHEFTVPCYVDVSEKGYTCTQVCATSLSCGHVCKRKCHECVKVALDAVKIDHGRCKQRCGRKYSTCAHSCAEKCHGDQPCPPCQATCDVRCSHSKCSQKCNEHCMPCAHETCDSACPHSQCTMPCAAPCNHIPCSRRCEKELECGHQCPSICGERCPLAKFCQVCGSDDVKNYCVDFILGETYAEINLNENPCIFPECNHYLTMENMDQLMEMREHYVCDGERRPVALKDASRPFSIDDIKTCAICRGSLRGVFRYGRLVRRALLDEGTKRFTLYVNREYVPLAQKVQETAMQLQEAESFRMDPWPENICIKGARDDLIRQMKDVIIPQSEPWKNMLQLRGLVKIYRSRVSHQEQPYKRVWDMVEFVKKRGSDVGAFEYDNTILQSKGFILATALSLRLDIALLADFLKLRRHATSRVGSVTIQIDLQHARNECLDLIELARTATRPYHEVEGYVFLAQLFAMESSISTVLENEGAYRDKAKDALHKARMLCEAYPGQTSAMKTEIDTTDRILLGSTFYTAVTNEERTAVIKAMAREFLSTGHWYNCPNGHPFTIGECGGAMQVSTCPECGAQVGGRHHQVVGGVTAAQDVDEAAALQDVRRFG